MHVYFAVTKGEKYDVKDLEMFYREMCKGIRYERARIGGDWVVTQAVPTRHLRNIIREELGSDLVFVCLDMSSEDQIRRLRNRHGEDANILKFIDGLKKMSKVFEPVGEDEENVFNLTVGSDMSREEVAMTVLRLVE